MRNKTGQYILWTDDERIKLKQMVSKGMSYKKISEFFPYRTAASLQSAARKHLNLNNNYRHKKWSHDVSFWSQINPVTAYFAGFSMADGHLAKKRHTFAISLNSKDKYLLEKLKELTSYSGQISSYQRKNYKKETLKNVSTLRINGCKRWYEDLSNYWGLTVDKTTRGTPNIQNDFIKLCWVLGYYDGDGWYSIKKEGPGLTMGVVSCNLEIMSFIKETLDRIFPELPKIGSIRTELPKIKKCDPFNYWELRITGIKALIIYDYFRQFKLPKLARKLNNPAIIERIEYYKQKFPELFYRKLVIPPEYEKYSMPDTPIYIPEQEALISQAIPESETPINNQSLVTT